MKKKKTIAELTVLAAVLLSGILYPGMQIVTYAKSQEGMCFYFDRLSGLPGKETDSLEKEEPEDKLPEDKLPEDNLPEDSLPEDKFPEDRTPGEGMTHWKIGDTVVGNVHGEIYRFRCIDQNYADQEENHRQAALFLCDTVIPADIESKYMFEELPDGSHGYVFYPGPLVDFGDSNEYKYSRVRSWLQEAVQEGEIFSGALPVHTGVSQAYSGSTLENLYSQMDAEGLYPAAIGSQQMVDRLFVLSVEEALKYREWLWRFEGEEENPQTQVETYCKGYWLRTPAGNRTNFDTDQVYVVDLVLGNLHPAAIRPQPDGDMQEEEISRTGIYGVRPAFVLPQS